MINGAPLCFRFAQNWVAVEDMIEVVLGPYLTLDPICGCSAAILAKAERTTFTPPLSDAFMASKMRAFTKKRQWLGREVIISVIAL